jgi:predicted phosphodiesterase
MENNSNVLVIGDTHLPFGHKNYLEFCKENQIKYKCKQVIHIGDLVDNHSISYHEHDPDGFSPIEEFKRTEKDLKRWFKAFKKVKICIGNHDSLTDRQRKTAGLSVKHFKNFREIWKLPKGWKEAFEWEIAGVLYKHGSGMSGRYAHVQAAERCRQSTVIGHIHSSSGVEYMASKKDRIFGANIGCGIDRKSYAFYYGKDFPRKPILSCGVVLNGGKLCYVIPMKL